MRTFLLSLTVLLLVSGTSLFGQDQSDDDAEANDSTDPDTGLVLDEDVAVDDDTETQDPEDEIQERSPGRFIPSEQISQDLGVSFPADI